MLSNVDMVVEAVKDCARCGGEHERLIFTPFTRGRPDRYSHWCLCPASGEPILYREENDAGAQVIIRTNCLG